MNNSHEQFDRPYRRGLVLGLSLAELFLILLFLLLLTTIGITSHHNKEKRAAEALARNLQNRLQIFEGNEISIEDYLRLKKQEREHEKVQKERDALAEETKDLKEKLDEFKKESNRLEKRNKELENENQQYKEEHEEEANKPGENPPCWFTRVTESDISGRIRIRHRPIKIFDVKITDDFYEVRVHDNSGVNGQIETGVIDALSLVSSRFLDTPINGEIFTEQYRIYLEVGEEQKVHDYSCRYMVDVYDETSPHNKRGYKENLKTIEGIFYKFEENGIW